ncbi:MAG: aldehyde dehydrogenase family protein [Clostridiaceae bacterium]|nr:aldehyde dehydrogenase family protein [Clostridiaceae bacterium]
MEKMEYMNELITKSKKAQKQFELFSQQQVDDICRAIAKVVYDNAEPLAKLAHEESGMGVYVDKIAKNKGKSKIIWNDMKGQKSVGIINKDEEEGLVYVAKPMGVIACVTPCTNPIVTPMCNIMFALKGRNSVIVAPHPRAKKCAVLLIDMFNKAIAKFNAPKDLLQVIPEPDIETSGLLMKSVDVVIATGGGGMVKAAYSSGKPAFGVGPGNVQCIIDRDMDMKTVVPKIIAGRIFDNGIICSGEQTIIAPREEYDAIMAEFEANGAYYTEDAQEAQRLRDTMFPGGVMNKDLVGQDIEKIAEAANIALPKGAKLIVVKAQGIGQDDYLSKEKMCSVISSYAYDTWEQAVEIATANLECEGKGHSVAIHSNNDENIEYAGIHLPVSRVLLNQICATMNGGAFTNSLAPSTTLGCGSWGNNSISENLSWRHLFNVSRIAYELDKRVPTDDEIWG